MQLDRLDNCKICGKLFLKDYTDYCLDCYKEIEQEYKKVGEFLKNEQNSNATIEEVSEHTGVSLKQVANFIRDGRIYAGDFPNLGYPCAYCGKLIKKQVLCKSCFEDLSTDIDQTLKKEEITQQILTKQQSHFKDIQYWRLKQDK